MDSPDVYLLANVRWQFFGTLTFKTERLPERVRFAMLFAFLRNAAGSRRVHFKELLWCVRQELGEVGGRLHLHFLLGGFEAQWIRIETCFALMNDWEACGGGWARVYVFDQRLNGVGYITKCLSGIDGADAYESAKFGWGNRAIIPSESVMRYLAANERHSRRRLERGSITGRDVAEVARGCAA